MEVLKPNQKEEIWLPVVDHEGLYEVSSEGSIRSLPKHHSPRRILMKTHVNLNSSREYCSLKSEIKQATHSVANLVAKAFVPNPNNYRFTRFIDGDESNHKASNLYWNKSNQDIDPDPLKIERYDSYKKTNGAWTLSSERAYFQNNKEAIMQQLILEKS